MRCKYTKFSYSANRSKIFFFNLTIRLLTRLSEIVKKDNMIISLNAPIINALSHYSLTFYNTIKLEFLIHISIII